MKTHKFFANVTGKALVPVAAVMMSIGFAACSSDNNDNVTPEDTVTIDGKHMPVREVEFSTYENGVFELALYLDEDKADGLGVIIFGDIDLHFGKIIYLTNREAEHEGKAYWRVLGMNEDRSLFYISGNPKHTASALFSTGMLRIDGMPMTGKEIKVLIKDGRVKDTTEDGDGKEHTISARWKGKPTGPYSRD